MLRLATAAALAAAALLPPTAAAREPCRPPHSRTVEQNGRIRVYSLYDRDAAGRRVWACFKGTGARTSLGYNASSPHYQEDVARIRLHGSIVGWLHSAWDDEASYYGVSSKDLRSGRVLHPHYAGLGDDGCSRCYAWEPRDLVMDGAGAIAWTARGTGEGVSVRQVMKSDDPSGPATIDRSPEI